MSGEHIIVIANFYKLRLLGSSYMRFIYHPQFLEHLTSPGCMERPERLDFILDGNSLIAKEIESLENGENSSIIELVKDSPDELKRYKSYLQLFHTEGYIEEIESTCAKIQDKGILAVDEAEDTYVGRNSFNIACLAVGASVRAAQLAKSGQNAFALVRPPGHHAHPDKASGFCIFNNIAIATEYLLQQEETDEKKERVMIIDVDLHLGDGTLKYVENQDRAFYFSINHNSIWPVSDRNGLYEPVNSENVFLRANADDELYVKALEQRLIPAIEQFSPTIIAVSAGFDTHAIDNTNYGHIMGGGFMVGKGNWAYKRLKEILDDTLKPYFLVLEGGYDPLSVSSGVLAFTEERKSFKRAEQF
jgi:acetoin utilization deacetylase AcuC-like enzyme